MPFKNQKLKGGAVAEQEKIQLLVKDTPEATEKYSTEPTCAHLNDLTLRNLKFMSTHNSFIQPCQYGCQVRTMEVGQYLSKLEFFPICLEIDLMACKVQNQIQVFHFGGKSGRQYMSLDEIFDFILAVIQNIKTSYFFPLLLSIDTTQITTARKTGGRFKKCPPNNEDILDKNDILTQFKEKFSDYLHQIDEDGNDLQTDLNYTLPYLMGKVLIRFRHEGTNIGDVKNVTVQFKGKGKRTPKSITDNEKFFLRVFPSGGDWRQSLMKAFKSANVRSNVAGTTGSNRVSSQGNNRNNEEDTFGFGNNNVEDGQSKNILRKGSINLNMDEVNDFVGFKKNTGSSSTSTIYKEDKEEYKTLSTLMIDSYLFQNNNINCLAFNWQHLTVEKQNQVTEAFKELYRNVNSKTVHHAFKTNIIIKFEEEFINKGSANGGGKKNKTRKKQRRKRTRRRKSNKKRYFKK